MDRGDRWTDVNRLLCPRPIGSKLPKDESRMIRDLSSAYVLCLRTLVVPNLQRDKRKSQESRKQTGRLRRLTKLILELEKLQNYRNELYI